MRSKIGAGLAGFVSLVMLAGCSQLSTNSSSPTLNSVNQLGNVTVGQSVPGYGGGSASGRGMGPKPSRGEFLVHVLSPDLPITCVDDECGDVGAWVVEQGGQLFGGSDQKLAYIFGVLPEEVEGSVKPLEYSVVIVSDKHGKVTAIYNNSGLESVKEILGRGE
jgi:hypothetical protein